MLRPPKVWLQYYQPNTSDTGTGKTRLGFGSFIWMFFSPTAVADGPDSLVCRLDGTPLPGPQGPAAIIGIC